MLFEYDEKSISSGGKAIVKLHTSYKFGVALTNHVSQQRSPSCFSSGVVESREFLFIFQSGDKNEDHSGPPPTICPVRPRTSVFYELLQSAFVVRGMEGREGDAFAPNAPLGSGAFWKRETGGRKYSCDQLTNV